MRAPHTRLPRSGKKRSALMLRGLSRSCSRLVTSCVDLHDAADHLVGRRLVHAALDVDARVDAGHVARGRRHARLLHRRIAHFEPRVVERRVLGVERLAERRMPCDARQPSPADRGSRSGPSASRSAGSARSARCVDHMPGARQMLTSSMSSSAWMPVRLPLPPSTPTKSSGVSWSLLSRPPASFVHSVSRARGTRSMSLSEYPASTVTLTEPRPRVDGGRQVVEAAVVVQAQAGEGLGSPARRRPARTACAPPPR